jgi:D-alanyl-D-alanine carboxypeptidase (penicillin-binding protein 5/6)
MKKIKMNLLFLLGCLAVSFLLSIIFVPLVESKERTETTDFSIPYVSARSCIVMETKTHRILYEKNAKEQLLPASITKILTCITALELMEKDRIIQISYDATAVDGSRIYVERNEIWTLEQLLYGLMLSSGNDAATAIAESYSGNKSDFIYEMNECAKKIGMNQSYFTNPTGLDSITQNKTTAYDMALLMSYALQNEDFRKITSTKKYSCAIQNKGYLFRNKHRLIQSNDEVTGGKTGYTEKAKRTLVTSYKRNNMEIVVVTFQSNNDWEEHNALANYCFHEYHLEKMVSNLTLYFTLSKLPYPLEAEELFCPMKESEVISTCFYYNEDGVCVKYLDHDQVIGEYLLEREKDT